eukprot:TRINITY_DN4611_c0_g6_i1.p1 TRINITY_DN4611_c0_g6~~TRINITY_DN4611_c0_g6_i1.p1  ORF type:complete len:332 (+),score=55.19 TRINITY_DN4611_c0_g6_i1:71-1066(+)
MWLRGKAQSRQPQQYAIYGEAPPRTRLFQLWQAEGRPATVPGSFAAAVPSADGFERSKDVRPKSVGTSVEGVRAPLTPRRGWSAPSCDVALLPPTRPGSEADLLQAFKDKCRRLNGHPCHTWRTLLDPSGVGRVSFIQFCKVARSIGFKHVHQLWDKLDLDGSGFITLDEWDPVSFRCLMEFRHICYSQFGGLDVAFKYGIDRNGSATVNLKDLRRFCEDFDFSGDVETLFKALDESQGGSITVDELDFLATWEGERFKQGKDINKEFGFGYERWRQKAEKRKAQRKKIEQELLWQDTEKEAIGRRRSMRTSMIALESHLEMPNAAHIANG